MSPGFLLRTPVFAFGDHETAPYAFDHATMGLPAWNAAIHELPGAYFGAAARAPL